MKTIFNVLLICVLSTGVMLACPPKGDADAKAEKTENTDQAGSDEVEGTFTSLNLEVKGMTCGGCENKVKAALTSIDGVVETKKVCSQSDKADLTYDASVTSEEEIIKALTEKTGYAITMVKSAGYTDAAVKEVKEVAAGAVKKSCASECSKDCCKGKSKASCTKAQKAACTKSKAKAEKVLEEQ